MGGTDKAMDGGVIGAQSEWRTRMTRILAAFGLSLFLTVSSSSLIYGKNEHVKSVTSITEVFGDGQKVSAVAVEYDAAIANSKLAASAFSVDGKSITRIYANKAAEKAATGIDGRYVILELSTASRGSGSPQFGPGGGPGFGGPGSGPGRGGPGSPAAVTPISVTQVGDIATTAGERYAPDAAAITSDRTVNLVVDDFQQFVFTDPKTNEILRYNLFVPRNYDKNKSYPMVLFIHDASVVGTDTKRTLVQGVGGVIWAAPSEQAKHEAFVLAPQYHTGGVVNDNSEASEYLDITVNLVDAITHQYSIDRNRIYTTGQSMGCMLSIAMQIKYPDVFAASMLVAGQWDAKLMSALAHKNMWILVAEGDTKAFPGMNAATAAMEEAGGKVSRARWNARAGAAEMTTNVQKMIDEGANIKYTVFDKGTVWPEGQTGGMEHMQTWKVAYYVEGVRDWLFAQKK
jgi:predicted peptidase